MFSGRGGHTRRGGRDPGHLVHAPPDDGHFAPQSPRPVHVEGSGVLREVSPSSPNRYQRRSPGYGGGTVLSLSVLHSSHLCIYLLISASFLLFKDLLSHFFFMPLIYASLLSFVFFAILLVDCFTQQMMYFIVFLHMSCLFCLPGKPIFKGYVLKGLK